MSSGIKSMNKRDFCSFHSVNKIETIKKNQTKMLKLKNSINELKNELESLGNRAGQMKEFVILKIEI